MLGIGIALVATKAFHPVFRGDPPGGERMPQFKSREEYERWRAAKMGGYEEKPQPEMPPEKPPQRRMASTKPQPPSSKPPSSQHPSWQPPAFEPSAFEPPALEPPSSEPPSWQPPSSGGRMRSVGDLFRDSWEICKERYLTLICLYVFSILIMVVVTGVLTGGVILLASFLGIDMKVAVAGGGLLGIIPGFIAMFWGMTGFTAAALDETLGMRDALRRGWERAGSYIWVCTLLSFLLTGGFLLLVIPGILFLVWFIFCQFVLLDEDERGMNAILKSKEYVRGMWFSVFVRLFIILLVWVGLGFIPVIGSIFSILFVPFVLIFMALIYNDLKAVKGRLVFNNQSAGQKLKWIGTGALGYVAFPIILFFVMGATLTIPLMMLKGMMMSNMGEVTITPQRGKAPAMSKARPQQNQGDPQIPAVIGSGGSPDSQSKKPDATGEALVVRNGAKETYVLKTGFFSETRFADPEWARIQFEIKGAAEHSNARRIEMTLDATKAGEHLVDGKHVQETFMGSSQRGPDQEYKPRFQYIADGGQVFFPKGFCKIKITSPYTGTPDGIFAGEIENVVVHSAGIDNTLSAKFKIVGVPSR
jgi:hypothetical protein